MPGLSPVAFYGGASPEELAAARRALEARAPPPFGETPHSFCVRDPDGHEVELYVDPGRRG